MTERAETGLDDLTSFTNLSALDTGEAVSISYSYITVSKFDCMAKLLVEWTFSKTDIFWDQYQVSVQVWCPSSRESDTGIKEWQGPTLGFRFIEVSGH